VSDPVDEHIQAYNERSLERFVACFSADCVIEDARGTVLARGHGDLRAHFSRVFDESPRLHCEIVHRTRVGDYVVDDSSRAVAGPAYKHGRFRELRLAIS
jgi:hypothetical protein